MTTTRKTTAKPLPKVEPKTNPIAASRVVRPVSTARIRTVADFLAFVKANKIKPEATMGWSYLSGAVAVYGAGHVAIGSACGEPVTEKPSKKRGAK